MGKKDFGSYNKAISLIAEQQQTSWIGFFQSVVYSHGTV